jgi:hypothetical protein
MDDNTMSVLNNLLFVILVLGSLYILKGERNEKIYCESIKVYLASSHFLIHSFWYIDYDSNYC